MSCIMAIAWSSPDTVLDVSSLAPLDQREQRYILSQNKQKKRGQRPNESQKAVKIDIAGRGL